MGRSRKNSSSSKSSRSKGSLARPITETAAVLTACVILFLFLALASAVWGPGVKTGRNAFGWIGQISAAQTLGVLGWSGFYFCIFGSLLSYRLLQGRFARSADGFKAAPAFIGAHAVITCALAGIFSLLFGQAAGGALGASLAAILGGSVGGIGAVLVFLTCVMIAFHSAFNIHLSQIFLPLGLAAYSVLKIFGAVVYSLLQFLAATILNCAQLFGKLCVWAAEASAAKISEMRANRIARILAQESIIEAEAKRKKKLKTAVVVEEAPAAAVQPEPVQDFSDPMESDLKEPKISRRDPAEVVAQARKNVKQRKEQEKAAAKTEARAPAAKDYEGPSLELLVSVEGSAERGPKDQYLIDNSRRLEEALANFKIGGRVVEVHPGPVITLYQFQPAAGVKVQRVINLADDLALALKVASVRVFAPVPGKGTVGIEVPNQNREMVRLREVLETSEYQTAPESLPLALGKDTYGDPFISYLPRMPHLLIAGATGTGKSVCINSLLLSLLYRNTPQELRLILIDPKMLELSVYEDIPHLKAPVVTNPKRARGVLWWAVEEMERRYRLLKGVGVRDVAAYNRLVIDHANGNGNGVKKKRATIIELNEKDVLATASPLEGLQRDAEDDDDLDGVLGAPTERLPRIVIVVDELADLMLSVGREIEELLTRLAQKARAAGLHLILATQRPSVNVITGLIKANFPARISFKVASKIDARTVMDTSGAEKLLGQGDMLFMSPSVGPVRRLHSPYVSDQEVHSVVEWLRGQGKPEYDDAIEEMISRVVEAEGGSAPGEHGEGGDYDTFYDQAVSLVVEKGQASTSMVQRAFRIGYNRAARILETMEREGIVGPADGSKPRQVLVGSMDGPI